MNRLLRKRILILLLTSDNLFSLYLKLIALFSYYVLDEVETCFNLKRDLQVAQKKICIFQSSEHTNKIAEKLINIG